MDNLKLWNEVEKTDPDFTTEVSLGGRKYTSVDAYYRIKEATKQFGNYGQGWWVDQESFDYTSVIGLCIYTALLHYDYDGGTGSLPIRAAIATHTSKTIWEKNQNTGKKELVPDEDFIKKVTTDALTKGLSFLGFSADVYLGKFEDANYRTETAKELALLPKEEKQRLEFELAMCKTPLDVQVEFSKATDDLKHNKEYLSMMIAKRDELMAIQAQELFGLSEEEAQTVPDEVKQPLVEKGFELVKKTTAKRDANH